MVLCVTVLNFEKIEFQRIKESGSEIGQLLRVEIYIIATHSR
jgi:hypothetical protein